MKQIRIALVGIVALATLFAPDAQAQRQRRNAGAAAALPDSARTLQELQPILDDMTLAANARDTDRFLKPFAHDGTFIQIFNGAVVTTGFDALRAGQLKNWTGPSDNVYGPQQIVSFKIMGPNTAVMSTTFTSKRTVPTVSNAGYAYTMVWERRADGWKIVHSHESTTR